MATMLKLGPGDHGRPMTFEEFLGGDYEEGHRYELIDGRLYVSPQPGPPHDWIEHHVYRPLWRYSETRPEIINHVTNKARVFVPRARRVTAPEPDVAAYRNFPLDRRRTLHWREVSPLLVVEVLGGEDDAKDLVRNVDLYRRVPSIQEYWVFDIRDDPAEPVLRVYRRRGDDWDLAEYDSRSTYTTDLLPGFALPVRPT